MSSGGRKVGLGVVGLGRAFTLMLPTFVRDARFSLVAAATPGAEARAAFEQDFGGTSYHDVDALCRDPAVEAVYVASPHQFHAEHVAIAAACGRHVLVDKPLAVTMAEGERMVASAEAAGVHLVVGPSHSFDAPVLKAREIIASGEVGAPCMIHAMNYTDFLYRPRRPEELDTRMGGGVVFSQAIHQIDVVRLLAGGCVTSVRALTGSWDRSRPTEGAYSALLEFEGGAFASLTYSGYGRFDSDEMMDWVSELGKRKNPDDYGGARRNLRKSRTPDEEAALKRARNYGLADTSTFTDAPLPDAHEHFGVVIVSCERGDLRLKADGVMMYLDGEKRFEPLPPPSIPRIEVMDELYDAVVGDTAPLHSGAWGLASLEAAVAIIDSAASRRAIAMRRQVGTR
ncbi:MAG: gfo/Idh/MocA family oxidoreductase [Proteobacteria bacterium]|nr:MAG: gfo/Idh/MocA family oxidoreductase [Pseudomonadota bacterium]